MNHKVKRSVRNLSVMLLAFLITAETVDCIPVRAVSIDVFPDDGTPPDLPVTYPATDLSRADVNNVNTDKNTPGIQTRSFDDSNGRIEVMDADNQSVYGDTIVYNGSPIRLKMKGELKKSGDAYIVFDQGDAEEPGGDAVFEVSGPVVEKRLVTARHQKIVKEYMGISDVDYISDEYGGDGEGSYQTVMFMDHLAERLHHQYGNQLAIDLPLNLLPNASSDELNQYNSASEYVHAKGILCNPEKFTYSLGTMETLISHTSNGDVMTYINEEIKQTGASGYGIRKTSDYRELLDIPKDAPHLENLIDYWHDMQNHYGGVFNPIDKGNCYEFNLGTFSEPLDTDMQIVYYQQEEKELKEKAKLDQSDHYKIHFETQNHKEYFLYFPFSNQQLIDAWAAEMDSWDGHWEYYKNGTIHLKNGTTRNNGMPGYEVGNWGNTWTNVQFGQHTDIIPDVYEYIINGPGVYTITMKGTNHYRGTVIRKINVVAGNSSDNTVTMYRAYNPNSGEHFYTSSAKEFDHIVSLGWRNEGTGWIAPKSSKTPVYRLYNRNGGEHHYTLSKKEKDTLVKLGWKDEGIGWYSDDSMRTPLYRQYNPNAFANNHNYTTSKKENDTLVRLGWRYEGIGWYGIRAK